VFDMGDKPDTSAAASSHRDRQLSPQETAQSLEEIRKLAERQGR
jgi:hypothetical protein